MVSQLHCTPCGQVYLFKGRFGPNTEDELAMFKELCNVEQFQKWRNEALPLWPPKQRHQCRYETPLLRIRNRINAYNMNRINA